MMKCGVTTVNDYFYLHNDGIESDEMIIRAARDCGIHLVLSRTMYDWDGAPKGFQESIPEAVRNTTALHEQYKDTDMVSILPAPHSLHAASLEMIQAGHELAQKWGCKYHMHLSEEPFEVEQVKAQYDGFYPVELLDKIGVVDNTMVFVHGVWLKESEIETLGHKGASLAYCPSSNMFLADGVTNLVAMKKANVAIGLGTDGACGNNRNSIVEEMRMASILQKAVTHDATCITYHDAFDMGTKNGGEILQLPVGVIEANYKADFIGIALDDFSMMPMFESLEQMLPNLVYSLQPTAIKHVVVNGIQTVNNGELTITPEKSIMEGVKKTMSDLEHA